jgi:hypothetical protein
MLSARCGDGDRTTVVLQVLMNRWPGMQTCRSHLLLLVVLTLLLRALTLLLLLLLLLLMVCPCRACCARA